MIQKFQNISNVKGELYLPGDKSISHRSVMFSSMADGVSVVRNCSNAEDVASTMACFSKLGVNYEISGGAIKVYGKGFKGFNAPLEKLDAGNSGTTARLISGILCAQNFESFLTGDESLSKRPMKRIVEPLRNMGAEIYASENSTLPVAIKPSANLHPVKYKLEVSSAQVKSSLLLAAIHLEDESIIIETEKTRNHTEKLLGLRTEKIGEGTKIFASKKNYPKPFELTVPSDISTAAFFIVLASLLDKSEIILRNVSLNETRIGILAVLKNMGANISIENESEELGELRGDLRILSAKLSNTDIPLEIIPNIIDEIPILSVAGVFAEGNFKITGAKELRVKESDRINALCVNYKNAGLNVNEFEDGFELSGSITNNNLVFESYGDHRIAMAFAILSLIHKNGGAINDFECVGISNPNFLSQIAQLC